MPDNQELSTPPFNRKRPSRFFGQYIIKTRLQVKFALTILIFLGVATFFIWMEGHVAVKSMVDSGMVMNEDAILQLKLLNKIIGKTIILGLAVTFGLSLFFSHFIAGPIYRFEKTLEEMKNGNLTIMVKLRKHDELKDMADLFNQMLASLRNKVKKERDGLQSFVAKLESRITELRQLGRLEHVGELEQLLEEIKKITPQIRV